MNWTVIYFFIQAVFTYWNDVSVIRLSADSLFWVIFCEHDVKINNKTNIAFVINRMNYENESELNQAVNDDTNIAIKIKNKEHDWKSIN